MPLFCTPKFDCEPIGLKVKRTFFIFLTFVVASQSKVLHHGKLAASIVLTVGLPEKLSFLIEKEIAIL